MQSQHIGIFLNKCRYANGDGFMINESSIYLLKDMEPLGRQELLKVLEGQYKAVNLTYS